MNTGRSTGMNTTGRRRRIRHKKWMSIFFWFKSKEMDGNLEKIVSLSFLLSLSLYIYNIYIIHYAFNCFSGI